METSRVLLDQVLILLRSYGYPDDAFALEWPVSKHHRADLAVVDTASGNPIALVELKATSGETSLQAGRDELRRLARELGREVLLFLAYPREGGTSPVFERVLPAPWVADDQMAAVPDFTIARSTQRTKAQAQIVKEGKRSLDKFAVTCWLCAVGVVVLGVLDYRGTIEMTAPRLTLLGVAVGLTILPFANKLKFLGWEFHRLQGRGDEGKQ